MRSQETAGKPIPRPSSGLGGKDWNLREAMKLGGNHQLYRDIRVRSYTICPICIINVSSERYDTLWMTPT